MNEEKETNKLPVAAVNLPAARIETVIAQRRTIMSAVKEAMSEGVHYGKVPGCGDKPTCFKPGAEVLCLLFGLRAHFEEKLIRLDGGHIESTFLCTLLSPDDQVMGQGIGACSSLESKYRWRNASLKCPTCGKDSIIKGKAEYGGGWVCFAKRGGCGAKWPDGAAEIEGQARGKVENTDIADTWNTVRKIAKKRAHVDAALTTTGASEFFTQDVEDFPEYAIEPSAQRAELKPAPAEASPRKAPPNEHVEADIMADLYKLDAPASKRFGGKRFTLAEIYRQDPRWIPAVLADPKRAAACTPRDLINLREYWAVVEKVKDECDAAISKLAAEEDGGSDENE